MPETPLSLLYEEIATALEKAPRRLAGDFPAGDVADDPEGTVTVSLSATLADRWSTQLRAAAAKQRELRFIPDGADKPLPPLPGHVDITADEVQAAVDAFDHTAPPSFRGLLDAAPKP